MNHKRTYIILVSIGFVLVTSIIVSNAFVNKLTPFLFLYEIIMETETESGSEVEEKEIVEAEIHVYADSYMKFFTYSKLKYQNTPWMNGKGMEVLLPPPEYYL